MYLLKKILLVHLFLIIFSISYCQSVITGKVIYVDGSNPNATDTRGTSSPISPYSISTPFKTIQAATSSLSYNDVLYIMPGTYNENINLNGSTIFFPGNFPINIVIDHAQINGGNSPAIYINGNWNVFVTMNNSTITNSGLTTDRHNTAAIIVATARLNINGNGGTISSTEGDGIYWIANDNANWSNVTVTSTNGYGIYSIYGGSFPQMTNCKITSTNGGAMYGASHALLNNCTVSSSDNCMNLINQISDFSIINSSLISLNGYVLTNTGTGGSANGKRALILNSVLQGNSGILNYALGSASFDYGFEFQNNKLIFNSSAAFNISTSSAAASLVKAFNTISSGPLYTDAFRSSAEGIKVIRESNTTIADNSAFFGGNAVVQGTIKLGNMSTDPIASNSSNGMLYYNTSSNIFRAFKNGAWADLGSGSSGSGTTGWALAGGNAVNSSTDYIGSNNGQPVIFKSSSEVFRINSNGQLIIGTDNAPLNYKLAVNGDAIFNKVKVQLYSAPWADYVFDSSYKLPPLKYVEKFIKENKHLEGVPTSKDVKDNGIDLGNNQAILLKKIEELTLYIIDLKRQVEGQNIKIKSLEKSVNHKK